MDYRGLEWGWGLRKLFKSRRAMLMACTRVGATKVVTRGRDRLYSGGRAGH